jgi:tRNA(Leu) C34 or U34 (ribose-2'-O)-methylase TrmL
MAGRSPSGRATHEPGLASRPGHSVSVPNAAILLHYPKYLTNLGMIARVAGCYGAGAVWYSGKRISLEVRRLPRELRMRQYVQPAPIELYEEAIQSRTPVAVEVLDYAESLPDFVHPTNPLYIFGPEDGTLPAEVLRRCHRFVHIPAAHCLSLPVAVATVLYDRAAKAQAIEARRAETLQDGSVHESAVGAADAPNPGQSSGMPKGGEL